MIFVTWVQKTFTAVLPSWIRHVVFGFSIAWIIAFYANRYEPGTGFTGILRFAKADEPFTVQEVREVPRKIWDGPSFDGAMYASMSIDPFFLGFEAEKCLDSPRYRSRRILLSWIAWVAGIGNTACILNVYAVLNGVFWIVLTTVICYTLRPVSLRAYLCYGTLLYGAGTFESLQYGVTDLPSAVLAVAGLVYARFRYAGLGMALLTRETALLALPAWINPESRRSVIKSVVCIACALLPFGLWIGYTYIRFPEYKYIGNVVGWPAFEMIRRVGYSLFRDRGEYSFLYLGVAISLSIQAAYFIIRRQVNEIWWRGGIVCALFYFMYGSTIWLDPYWVMRSSLLLTFFFNLSLADAPFKYFMICWLPGNVASMFLRSIL